MKWIKTKDQLPENGQDVIFWKDGSVWMGFYDTISSQIGDFYCLDDMIVGGVTHWMPLPPKPEEDDAV